KFTKMHGIGNDYIYVYTAEFSEEGEPDWCSDQDAVGAIAMLLSDRHFGIGSDGLVLMRPSTEADIMMDMYNSDGSRGLMCGNAIRCVARYVYERGHVRKTDMTIETLSGLKTLELSLSEGQVSSVTVDMGKPEFSPTAIPVNWQKEKMINEEISVAGRIWQATAVSMGNPHAVVFVDDPEALELEKLGPDFENHSLFPQRINTEFVQVLGPGHLRMRVWERGSGETMACGTGSCASLAAAYVNGICEREAVVTLNGGDLHIRWHEMNDHIYMTGPASFVFEGSASVCLQPTETDGSSWTAAFASDVK
ncbi:MAG: diaminopimelate epimerase, partial [Clostridiaceae bacterium]|nr:diaminopimelate epimerase [Clostridiaceae bacterium]